jgi:hypothetical protein
MRRGLTTDWSIDIDPEFTSQVVDGDLQLVAAGRTIWIAVWSPPVGQPITDTLSDIKEDVHPDPEQRFEEPGTDADELRYASWYPETVGDESQFGLYGYTIRPGSYVQAAFLIDDPLDLPWALDAWRSLRHQP